ncbi:uncharacterized protein K444DRAFT_166194 [Hyaloscypha bicolor E]|uniref:Uncharacterized protein n=1 Tax=Hyaloscypha bicolor E TaxID=1095630 RepID=A0A2J6TT67_9HELO|nr:uncharacterized protein K444DRAFT_166194 [Hyaloscypha bicolor E]PMD66207.1 hypothetical protein K444DRAFT_166194 [Hyaloscypha bicolor E]
MNSPSHKHNRLPAEGIGQAVDGFVKWLESEQSAISLYFARHPSICRSFLEAVQRVTSRESLVTPVATPVENALDDEPTASDSKEVGDRTDSITRDVLQVLIIRLS